MQKIRYSIPNALELRIFYIKPSIYNFYVLQNSPDAFDMITWQIAVMLAVPMPTWSTANARYGEYTLFFQFN